MNDVNLCEGCAVMPPDVRAREVPFAAAWLVMGATVTENYKGRDDTVRLELDGDSWVMAVVDYGFARRIAEVVSKMIPLSKLVSPRQVLSICREASRESNKMGDSRRGKRGVVMLKDRSGSGYWRMVLPARAMDTSDCFVDVTADGAPAESLLEYETVFVQRLHDWDSFYMLEKLKVAGKRVVYDIDDDIFNIAKDNPAAKLIGQDEKMAAVACMRLADVVTVTTDRLADAMRDVAGKEPVVIPNAVAVDWWRATPLTGSPDGWKRVFWQGGDTHGEDWLECLEAVDAIMAEREDVRMVILGYLPPPVLSVLDRPYWKGRVEFLSFRSPETYFEMMKHVRAEVGIAPLRDSLFNRAKSPLKFLEYAAMGMPTVASDVGPYSDVIDDGVNGVLAHDAQEWWVAITSFLDDKERRQAVLESARRKVKEQYDIRNVAREWKKVLLP